VVTGAERAEAFRVQPAGPSTRPTTQPVVVGLTVLAGPVKVPDDARKQLAGIFSDPATYDFGMAMGCLFHPDVAIRFWKGEQALTVVLCFSCDELQVFVGNQSVGVEDDDNQRVALLRIVKKLFPE